GGDDRAHACSVALSSMPAANPCSRTTVCQAQSIGKAHDREMVVADSKRNEIKRSCVISRSAIIRPRICGTIDATMPLECKRLGIAVVVLKRMLQVRRSESLWRIVNEEEEKLIMERRN